MKIVDIPYSEDVIEWSAMILNSCEKGFQVTVTGELQANNRSGDLIVAQIIVLATAVI